MVIIVREFVRSLTISRIHWMNVEQICMPASFMEMSIDRLCVDRTNVTKQLANVVNRLK